jgi:hypothetical protein
VAVKPEIKSYDEYLEESLNTYLAKIGVTDLTVGSAVLSFFEANAQLVYRASGAVLQTLNDNSVDRATGDQLKKLAIAARVLLRGPVAAKSHVTIRDSSFEKITTKIYAGASAPNINSLTIKVGDASKFPNSGQIYIGRGTSNIEGPIPYSGITPIGVFPTYSYYEITLLQPTIRFHNISETVTLAQGGNRQVLLNTVVQTSALGGASPVKYITTENVTILDGENEVENVPIVAIEPSASGNQPRNAIKTFTTPPFAGATVFNPSAISNGRDNEDDESLRIRIKQAEASKGLGSPFAVESAAQGAQAPDESATVLSSQLVRTASATTLFVDDGTGYERKTQGVGIEYLVDSAIGGEKTFQLAMSGRQTSVAKAFLLSNQAQPYSVFGGDKLTVLVGGDLSEHQFDISDFQSNGAATAYEIVASINANPNLKFQATTSGSGKFVILQAKSESQDYLEISTPTSGTNAALAFNFPAGEIETLRLYKNDTPLSGYGRDAFVNTQTQSAWSTSINDSDTLIISIDDTAPITYTFSNTSFAEYTPFPFTSSTNTLESWVTVMNKTLTGVTASVDGLTIRLTSNKGADSKAKISISPTSTLVSKGMFSANNLDAVGVEKDFTLNRNTGQLELTKPLAPKDNLTAGTFNSFASIRSGDILGATVTLANEANFWILVDDYFAQRVTTLLQPGLTIDVTSPSTNTIRFTASTSVFAAVNIGDYFINSSTDFAAANRIEGRIKNKTNTWFELELSGLETPVVETVTYLEGFSFTRSSKAPQRIKINAGTYNINDLAIQINQSAVGAFFSVEDDLRIVIQSKVFSGSGAIMVQHADLESAPLFLPEGINAKSFRSLSAFVETEPNQIFMPYFAHTTMATESVANPPDSFLNTIDTSVDLELYAKQGAFFNALNPFGQNDAQGKNEFSQIRTLNSNTVTLESPNFIKRLRLKDRAFPSRPFEFGPNSNLVIILDNNSSEKTFYVPLYRNIETNTTHINNASDFNAYDTDFGPTGNLSNTFGPNYNFNNYKAYMRAKKVLDQAGNENALIVRSSLWGKSGEFIKVKYSYPQNPNQDINHLVSVRDFTYIDIILPSGTSINSLADGTTEWNITVTPNTPVAGVDMVTVTYSGTGTAPVLSLSGAEYVNIKPLGEFPSSMIGVHRVSDLAGFLPTANSFSFPVESGSVTPISNISNLVPNTVTFYESTPYATAQEIVDYINDSISAYIDSEIVDDSGMSGSGDIILSSEENSNFTLEYNSLEDGENAIFSSDLGGPIQFSFKTPLNYISDIGYDFNDGEQIRLVPTTPAQVVDFLNTLAVTGLSTLTTIETGQKNTSVQISSEVVGSEGAVQIAGGTGAEVAVDVVNIASSEYGYAKTPVLSSQANILASGQLVKIEAKNLQEKETSISPTNSITVTPATPAAGQSTITIENKSVEQILFGHPRIDINDEVTWKVEKQGPLVCISWNGVGTPPNLQRVESCNFNIADTFMAIKISSSVFDLVATGNTDFQKVEINDILDLDFANFQGQYKVVGKGPGTKTIRLVSESAFESSNITATFTITDNANLIGDSITIGPATLTQGVDWAVGVDATATASNIATAISSVPNFNATSSLGVVTITTKASSPLPTYTYNNVGPVGATITNFVGSTATSLQALTGVGEGDSVLIEGPSVGGFDSLNRGVFRVIRAFNNSIYIENDFAVEEEVMVSNSSVAITVPLTNTFTVADSPFDNTRKRLTCPTCDFSNVKVGDIVTFNAITTTVIGVGATYLETTTYQITNGTYNDATVTIKRPDMLFFQYDAACLGDSFVFNGVNFITNQGKHSVVRTLSPNQLVVSSTLAPIVSLLLGANSDNIFLEEKTPYKGYKEISFIAAEPANTNISYLMLTPNKLASKINQAYLSQIKPTSRLGYSNKTAIGLDAYRHDIGMLAEVNRILYGDPRDKVTYSGVAAAGADIFINPPLTKRVKLGISIRLQTGIPLAAITEQVRNTVQALIDSNPTGESIAISSIIAAVNEISGVRALAISSPLYDINNDMIAIQPGEKSRIINPVSDISVSSV